MDAETAVVALGLLAWPLQAEDFRDPAVVAIAKTCQRLEFQYIENAILDAVIAQMNTNHLSQNKKIRLSSQGNDVGHPAFKRSGGGAHARTVDFPALLPRDVCLRELVDLARPGA